MSQKYRDVRRILRKNGFVHVRTVGSHEYWAHADGRRTSVAGGGKDNRDVPVGTLRAMRQQTGIEDLR